MAKDKVSKDEDWMQKKWRPMMAIMYMSVCIFDFIVFPIMFTVVQFWETQIANDAFRQWQPITLLGGGLFHVAMGAVLGVTAWGRTQEKLNGANNGGLTLPSSGSSTPGIATAIPTSFEPTASSSGFPGTNSTGSFGGGGFGNPSITPTSVSASGGGFGAPAKLMVSSTGKPMPFQPERPEI